MGIGEDGNKLIKTKKLRKRKNYSLSITQDLVDGKVNTKYTWMYKNHFKVVIFLGKLSFFDGFWER